MENQNELRKELELKQKILKGAVERYKFMVDALDAGTVEHKLGVFGTVFLCGIALALTSFIIFSGALAAMGISVPSLIAAAIVGSSVFGLIGEKIIEKVEGSKERLATFTTADTDKEIREELVKCEIALAKAKKDKKIVGKMLENLNSNDDFAKNITTNYGMHFENVDTELLANECNRVLEELDEEMKNLGVLVERKVLRDEFDVRCVFNQKFKNIVATILGGLTGVFLGTPFGTLGILLITIFGGITGNLISKHEIEKKLEVFDKLNKKLGSDRLNDRVVFEEVEAEKDAIETAVRSKATEIKKLASYLFDMESIVSMSIPSDNSQEDSLTVEKTNNKALENNDLYNYLVSQNNEDTSVNSLDPNLIDNELYQYLIEEANRTREEERAYQYIKQ